MSVRRKPSIVYWLGSSLYLNITSRCSNNCYFCIRNFTDGVGGFNLKLKRDPTTAEIISELQQVINRRDWSEIVFCGFGEPTERLDCLLEIVRWIRKYHGKSVLIRIDTNGHGCLLNRGRDVVTELKEAGVDKISVSLNAHDKETYNHICRPKFSDAYESVLGFIAKAKDSFDLEVTVVPVPEVDIPKTREITEKMGVKLKIREYFPCSY